jgi:23S rRNA (cytidine2498-2'-O)-methyltransferase
VNHLFLHCRPGFEKECAAEITDLANDAGFFGYSKTRDNAAFVEFITHEPDGALQLIQQLPFKQMIFTRQWFAGPGRVSDLPVTDRLTPLLSVVEHFPPVASLIVETPDTNDGKELTALGKKFAVPFTKALQTRKKLINRSAWQMHLVFLSGTEACVGVSPVTNSSQWVMGIPRLRMPSSAPSRATLKLEEAWHHFVPAQEWEDRLALSMKAVDLGAAPGGWTWQLVKRGMFVDAIDNGPMDKALMDSGQVNHILADGFVYEPKKPVDWLVCDIVDKPARVAGMISRWVTKGWCREVVFNLKLPMKQRYAEVKKCEERLMAEMAAAGIRATINFKQLYHDREEVTGHIRVLSPSRFGQ